MALETLEIVNSIFSLITVLFFAIIGIYIASKYVKYKNRTLLYLGIAWVFLGCSWWPSAASFLTILLREMDYLYNYISFRLNLYQFFWCYS